MSTPHKALDRPEVLRVLFHPRPQFGDGGQGETVMIPVADGIDIGARLYRAAATDPLLLFFHGNGEIAADYDDIAPMFTALGMNMLVVDYRGYGLSGGRPGSVSLAGDALAIFEEFPAALSNLGVSYGPVMVMGRSLGSAAAIHVAATVGEQIVALILDSPFAETFELLYQLGGPEDMKDVPESDGFGNLQKIGDVTVPTLIIHGQEDHIIPVDHAHRLAERSGAMRKRLLTVPGAGHNDLLYVGQKAYLDAVKEYVEFVRKS